MDEKLPRGGNKATPAAPPVVHAGIRKAMLCLQCQTLATAGQTHCKFCGAALADDTPTEVAVAVAPPPVQVAPKTDAASVATAGVSMPTPVEAIGRSHSPGMALLLALLIPGAGQAYNGKPIKGFFLLFASVLVLPWLYSLYDAYAGAKRIVGAGGRYGKGGWIWVALQTWLAANVTVVVLIVLTLAGVLR